LICDIEAIPVSKQEATRFKHWCFQFLSTVGLYCSYDFDEIFKNECRMKSYTIMAFLTGGGHPELSTD
jgi:hypothetical protein